MSVNDPIADMLTRIRNGVMASQSVVAIPQSKIKVEIARILKEEGFIEGYEVVESEKPGMPTLRVKLKYVGERREKCSVITGLERVSRPGRRVYTQKHDIPWVFSRDGYHDPIHTQGCDDRTASSPARYWRRTTL